MSRTAYVLGGHITPFIGKRHPDFIWKNHPDFGTRTNPTLEASIQAAVLGALEATGVPASAVQKGWIGNFVGELFSSQGHLGAAVAGCHADLKHKPMMRVEGACASGGLAFASAVESIRAGTDVALVVGAEIQTTASARTGGDYLARASHYARQRGLDDFTFPAMFARRIKAMTEAGHVDADDLARASVKAYANANRNPLAHMQAVTMDFDTARTASDRNPAFLGNEDLKPWLKVSDCSQVSDGAAAAIVVSEEGLRALGRTPADAVEVLACEVAAGDLFTDDDMLSMPTTRAAADRAWAASGLTPSDIQVAEVHDCFTIAEILMYEALGFAEPGHGRDLLRDGATDLSGRIPVNTGGGLVGFGHPVGATGVKQILEVVRQMEGACGDYQLATRPEVGLCANMGGDDKTAVVSILRHG